jgi:acyl carrier protein
MPSVFVFLDALPVNRSGKLDRLSLPTPEQLRPELEAAYAAPRSEVESSIAAVWQELLPVDKVGIQDNFFDLGGHSLLLLQAHGKLQTTFDGAIPMVDMFRYPTVAALAEYLGQGGTGDAARQDDGRAGKRSAGKNRLGELKRRRQRNTGKR